MARKKGKSTILAEKQIELFKVIQPLAREVLSKATPNELRRKAANSWRAGAVSNARKLQRERINPLDANVINTAVMRCNATLSPLRKSISRRNLEHWLKLNEKARDTFSENYTMIHTKFKRQTVQAELKALKQDMRATISELNENIKAIKYAIKTREMERIDKDDSPRYVKQAERLNKQIGLKLWRASRSGYRLQLIFDEQKLKAYADSQQARFEQYLEANKVMPKDVPSLLTNYFVWGEFNFAEEVYQALLTHQKASMGVKQQYDKIVSQALNDYSEQKIRYQPKVLMPLEVNKPLKLRQIVANGNDIPEAIIAEIAKLARSDEKVIYSKRGRINRIAARYGTKSMQTPKNPQIDVSELLSRMNELADITGSFGSRRASDIGRPLIPQLKANINRVIAKLEKGDIAGFRLVYDGYDIAQSKITKWVYDRWVSFGADNPTAAKKSKPSYKRGKISQMIAAKVAEWKK